MAGSPLKTMERRLARQAILDGEDPVKALKPYTDRLKKIAREGDLKDATTLGAIREVLDRVDGKVAPEDYQPLGLDDLEGALEAIGERRRARQLEAQTRPAEIDVTPEVGD